MENPQKQVMMPFIVTTMKSSGVPCDAGFISLGQQCALLRKKRKLKKKNVCVYVYIYKMSKIH